MRGIPEHISKKVCACKCDEEHERVRELAQQKQKADQERHTKEVLETISTSDDRDKLLDFVAGDQDKDIRLAAVTRLEQLARKDRGSR
jgi:predicted O-methyltransferase YrrM